jgi:hypothetical protein
MKKFETKRAILTLVNQKKLSSEVDIYGMIKDLQQAIKDLPQPLDRTTPQFFRYHRDLKRLRLKLKTFRDQRYVFTVYIKQYKQTESIAYDFQHNPLGPSYRKAFKEMIKEVVDMAIRRIRHDRKNEPRTSIWFGRYAATFSTQNKESRGRVFLKDGEVLRIYVEKNLNSLYADKKPLQPRKYVGIELEFCAPIKENEFAVKLFRSGIHKFAQLKKDASLRPHDGETGYELAILLEESNYKKRLKQLVALLTEVKAVAIDRRAGLHVHLDMRRRNKDLVYNNLIACQYALLSIVDPKRCNNEFCRIVETRKFPTEFTGEREERYKTINAAAFYKYKTLEVRMHEGSVDYAQISNWVDLLIRIANSKKKIKNDVIKVSTLKKRITLDEKLYTYIQDRSCHWQLQATPDGEDFRNRIARLAENYTQTNMTVPLILTDGQDLRAAPGAILHREEMNRLYPTPRRGVIATPNYDVLTLREPDTRMDHVEQPDLLWDNEDNGN